MNTPVSQNEYWYHVEDGQFSFDFTDRRLLGNEGDILKIATDRNDEDELYILFIDGTHVECIGNIERTFPQNRPEHIEIRTSMQELYDLDE